MDKKPASSARSSGGALFRRTMLSPLWFRLCRLRKAQQHWWVRNPPVHRDARLS
jgi:hypothetical protein